MSTMALQFPRTEHDSTQSKATQSKAEHRAFNHRQRIRNAIRLQSMPCLDRNLQHLVYNTTHSTLTQTLLMLKKSIPSAPGYATYIPPSSFFNPCSSSKRHSPYANPLPYPPLPSPPLSFPFLFFSFLSFKTPIRTNHGLHSLSLALPVGPSSSSPSRSTTSSPAIIANSAFCSVDLNSVFRGSTSSKGFNFALLRILYATARQISSKTSSLLFLQCPPTQEKKKKKSPRRKKTSGSFLLWHIYPLKLEGVGKGVEQQQH